MADSAWNAGEQEMVLGVHDESIRRSSILNGSERAGACLSGSVAIVSCLVLSFDMPIEVVLPSDAFLAKLAPKRKWGTMLFRVSGCLVPLDICLETKWLLRTGRDWAPMLPVVFHRIVFAKSVH